MTPATVISADSGKTENNIIQEARRIISAYEAAGGFDYTTPSSKDAIIIASKARNYISTIPVNTDFHQVYDILHRIAFGLPAR